MNGKIKMCFGTGAPSIIVTFVILCLTTLGALSLTTANADWRLAGKSAEYTAAYYEADARAERWLAQVDEDLRAGLPPESTTAQFPVTDRQALFIAIELRGDTFRETQRRLVNTEDWNYEEYAPQFEDVIVE